MIRLLLPWLLTGALAASTGLNVYYAANLSPTSGPTATSAEPAELAVNAEPAEDPACCEILTEIELTPDQRDEIVVCCPKYARQCRTYDDRIADLVVKLEQEVAAENPREEVIQELAEQIGQAHARQIKCRARTIMKVKETLTPGQRERLINCCGARNRKCAKKNAQ
jgi:hypothetical protein